MKYARENRIPFFGICLGMQMAVVEYARNVLGLAGANSLEFDEGTPHPVVTLMASQVNVTDKGGTMRLGAYKCALAKGSLAQLVYGADEVDERHRHRFEVNNQYRTKLQEGGLVISGVNPELNLVEMIELPADTHPHFVGCQFHPELQSRPLRPHPLFAAFVAAADRRRRSAAATHASAPALAHVNQ